MEQELGGASRGPLAGIRVTDFSTVVSGPLCAQILGDLGADVVKVETPRGDTTRFLGPPFVAGLTALYAHCNRNKRAIGLDLKREEARDVARRLAARADVLVQNFRPGVAERLGIGYDDLAADNPGLVYVAISGFGPEGPYAEQPAYDMLIQALSGLAHEMGEPGHPKLVRNLMADKSTALTASYAALGALFARERDPERRGQRVDVPMLDAYAAFGLVDALSYHTFPPVAEIPPDEVTRQIYRAWETKDGHVAAIPIEDHQFQALLKTLEREDLLSDPRCANLITRVQNAAEIFPLLEGEFLKWTTAEVLERARKFEAPIAPVHDLTGFLADPQVAANQTVFDTEDPDAGTLRLLRSPVRYAETPSSLRRLPPRQGEHTDEILAELALEADTISTLRAVGAVV
jgi:crotonobetainyl-CoA:carnitine CoA-transferase CaiB-like acyl-CoA transferase